MNETVESMQAKAVIICNVKYCARCEDQHFGVSFKRFIRSCPEYTHFALCPFTQEPILMKIVDE